MVESTSTRSDHQALNGKQVGPRAVKNIAEFQAFLRDKINKSKTMHLNSREKHTKIELGKLISPIYK